MSTVYLFGDEAGNFDFSDGRGATRYFILATVTMGAVNHAKLRQVQVKIVALPPCPRVQYNHSPDSLAPALR
jgi:hypothetical protein